MKAAKGIDIGQGRIMTPRKVATLRELSHCATGSSPVPGAMDGGQLAALVQFGLAERSHHDTRLGGWVYRITDAGLQFLAGQSA